MITIRHDMRKWYYIGSIFPFLSVITCWIIYYSMKHNTPGLVKTISETVCPFPESRIFAVTMNIESWILAMIYFMRLRAYKYGIEIRNFHKNMVQYIIMVTAVVLIPVGLAVLSAVTLDDNSAIHLNGAGVFFAGSIIYFILSDFALKSAGYKINIISLITSWVILGVCIIYMALLSLSKGSDHKLGNAGAVFQYITCLSIFFKVFLCQFDIPTHHIAVTKKE